MLTHAVDIPAAALPDFPILQQRGEGQSLVYLDSAASAQKPSAVIKAVSRYYAEDHANVHRGIYQLSQRATAAYEAARRTVRDFLHARHDHEIIFTKGTTEAINLVATAWGQRHIAAGDEIIISVMEHHSNIVPWQLLCERTGVALRAVRLQEDGRLDLEHYHSLLNERTKLLALVHVSNALGVVNPVKSMIEQAHARGIPVLLDGAQSVAHMPIDVQDLGCDFFAFSAHKLYGPTGLGVLYGRAEQLAQMPPYQGGGDMIRSVTLARTDYQDPPYRFEAGTPNIAGAVGLAAAIDYLNALGLAPIFQHEADLMQYASEALSTVSGLKILAEHCKKEGAISFVMKGAHPHDIGTVLDCDNIAIRAGHHCAMPLMDHLGLPATARISFGLYNSRADVDRLLVGLHRVQALFNE